MIFIATNKLIYIGENKNKNDREVQIIKNQNEEEEEEEEKQNESLVKVIIEHIEILTNSVFVIVE